MRRQRRKFAILLTGIILYCSILLDLRLDDPTVKGVTENIRTTVAVSICGDGIITGAEDCEDYNLGNKTCISLGYVSGDLSCDVNCKYVTKNCIAPSPTPTPSFTPTPTITIIPSIRSSPGPSNESHSDDDDSSSQSSIPTTIAMQILSPTGIRKSVRVPNITKSNQDEERLDQNKLIDNQEQIVEAKPSDQAKDKISRVELFRKIVFIGVIVILIGLISFVLILLILKIHRQGKN